MIRRCPLFLASVIVLMTVAGVATRPACAQTQARYETVFYPSGTLRIAAYLYRPAGEGPFPLVVYNHGSRVGAERQPRPFPDQAQLFLSAGYAVLVAERRGYGASDGPTVAEDVGNETGPQLIARLQEETDDVLAAVDYVKTLRFVDSDQLGVVGWSFGGIVTMLAISRSAAFKVAVDQAGGALTWNRSAAVRAALTDAAQQARAPVLLLVAANDNTTASITTVDHELTSRGLPHEMKIYPPFTPPRPARGIAPGHLVFSAAGIGVWGSDTLAFLGRYLSPAAPAASR